MKASTLFFLGRGLLQDERQRLVVGTRKEALAGGMQADALLFVIGRGGAVADASSSDVNVQGVRRFNELVAREPRVSATAIQTVGSKGYDGFALVLVTADA